MSTMVGNHLLVTSFMDSEQSREVRLESEIKRGSGREVKFR